MINLENRKSRVLGSWAVVVVLAALGLVLAVLQYRWLGEISRAERARLQEGLQSSLQRLARDGNAEISSAIAALRPPQDLIDAEGRQRAYAYQWNRYRERGAQPGLLLRAGLAVPKDETLTLFLLDPGGMQFVPADWPAGWLGMRDSLARRLRDRRGGPPVAANSALIEVPNFTWDPQRNAPAELEWLLIELDLEHVRTSYLPALLARHIGTGMPLHARVYDRFDPSKTIFETGAPARQPSETEPAASVTLLDINRFDTGRRPGNPFRPGGPSFRPPAPVSDSTRGRWQLDVNFSEGSLDAIVARLRWRNLAISAAILSLMLLTAILLVRFSRQQQELAELQMNFVAGVSHELRTPLTVIRTAAFNLRGRVAGNPAQVERYGALIQDESEKLTALVEQVLRFSSARAGHAVGELIPVAIEGVIDESIHARGLDAPASPIVLEKDVQDNLPLVMADEMALKHAMQNLLENAIKYGTENSSWIGVSARKVSGAKGDSVEVRIADRGPGIPAGEQSTVFHPFVRGRRAQQDQIHGTGLGLNLVKQIVEAHHGEIRLESEPGRGAAFIMRIPAAPAELQDEFANTAG